MERQSTISHPTATRRAAAPSSPTRREFLRTAATVAGALAASATVACDVREYARKHGAKQRLSIATGGTGGVYYIYGGALAHVISTYVPNVAATAEVTSASIDNLKFLRDGRADLALVSADAAADARQGTRAFKTFGRVPVVSLARLYTNYYYLVTLTGTGIASIADLRGRVVSTGVPGSATAMSAVRILHAAGIDVRTDIRQHELGIAASVDALKDGKIDATIQGGGAPISAFLDLQTTPRGALRLVPCAEVLPELQRVYGATVYYQAEIPEATYPAQPEPVPVIGSGTLLVADEVMSDALAYEITTALFDHQAEIAAIHPEGRNLTLASAVTRSPLPFHPGAIRYYRERGAWPT
jgi:TRAP transporter TAXI family solute receptor